MKIKGLIIGLLAMTSVILAFPVSTAAKTSDKVSENEITNVYIFGDSIMDGYLNGSRGIAYYLNINVNARKNNIKVVSDYSKEGSIICTDMPDQVDGIIKDIKKHKDEKNVVIFDGGTNDIVKGCKGNHIKNLKEMLKKIQKADRDVEFIVIIPNHITEYYDIQALTDTYTSLELLKNCETYKTTKRINSVNLQSDGMHIKAPGYRLIVSDLVRMMYEY